ncbi:DUF4166 domain-containing protein [Kineococcus arenarius]|uniref:DUF4166 domain-containing protein n=1 Tax=Kineococcus sp. SYSU DK007 TaxID=3383128 RepID=UPI003D7DD483
MDRVRHGAAWTLPFLPLGAWRNILVPDSGLDVPVSVEDHTYVDSFGRETVTVVRTFEIRPGRRRRFDAILVADGRGWVLDHLGTHRHLAVDLRPSVPADGSSRIVSGAQRFHEGPVAQGRAPSQEAGGTVGVWLPISAVSSVGNSRVPASSVDGTRVRASAPGERSKVRGERG